MEGLWAAAQLIIMRHVSLSKLPLMMPKLIENQMKKWMTKGVMYKLGIGLPDPLLQGRWNKGAAGFRLPLALCVQFNTFLYDRDRTIRRHHHYENILVLGSESQGGVITRAPGSVLGGYRSTIEQTGESVKMRIGSDVKRTVQL